jgi:glucose/arabinose dehydrogenase
VGLIIEVLDVSLGVRTGNRCFSPPNWGMWILGLEAKRDGRAPTIREMFVCNCLMILAVVLLAACGPDMFPDTGPAEYPVDSPTHVVPLKLAEMETSRENKKRVGSKAVVDQTKETSPDSILVSPAPFVNGIPRVELLPVTLGLNDPVQVMSPDDGTDRILVAERLGLIWIVQSGQRLAEPFLDIRHKVGSGREQGLLSLAFHPAASTNGSFFVNYTNLDGDTVIARYRIGEDPNRAEQNSGLILLRIEQPFRNHNGGQIMFGPDGFLYVGMGDGGSAHDPYGYGQDLNSRLGKILRFDVSNPDVLAIPSSNPFVGKQGALDAIWAYGVRNPWRFAFDQETGDLYIGDVGQDHIEEVNFVSRDQLEGPALNFGWNVMEGSECFKSTECDWSGMTGPVAEYSHAYGCSITGGFVYRGHVQHELNGIYLYGDWCSGTIWGLAQDVQGEWQAEILGEADVGMSSFGQDKSGNIYVTGTKSDTLYRLVVVPSD